MKEVILKYDSASGNLYDKNGIFLFHWPDLLYIEKEKSLEETSVDVNKVNRALSLKAAGVGPEEMIKLKEAGLL